MGFFRIISLDNLNNLIGNEITQGKALPLSRVLHWSVEVIVENTAGN